MARFIYPAGSGGSASADIADFIFINEDEDNSKMTLPINKEMTIQTTRDDDDDADINIESADDVFIRAYGDDIGLSAFNEVNISTDDDNYTWTFTNSGNFDLPGDGYISNPSNSSGDPNTPYVDTLHLVPDGDLDNDRYIILDPTSPNHIHIRAGGDMDNSLAELILGGEKTNVSVIDGSHEVGINTYDAEGDNYYAWNFGNDGIFNGPSGGLVKVYGLDGVEGSELSLSSLDNSIVLSASNGEFLNDASVPSNQIATIGDITNTVSDVTPYSPVWSGTGLAFTGTSASGYYVKVGSVVTVQIDVEFDNVTNFGTGQYSLTLPIASRYHTDVYGGSVHSVGGTTDHYSLKGHLSPSSTTMTIWSLKSSAQDEPFDHNSPVVLTTADKFHMSFTYICE